jgi:hypothetical protein
MVGFFLSRKRGVNEAKALVRKAMKHRLIKIITEPIGHRALSEMKERGGLLQRTAVQN